MTVGAFHRLEAEERRRRALELVGELVVLTWDRLRDAETADVVVGKVVAVADSPTVDPGLLVVRQRGGRTVAYSLATIITLGPAPDVYR